MPHLNGLRTAEYIRRMDKFAVIVFISADARYAVSGYAYEALAFLVKPITYENFAIEFKRCLEKVNDGKRRYVVFSTDNGMDRISIDKILYIESLGHRMAINTSDHTYYIYETLTSLEEKLPAKQFSRCNNCYLVNLAHVNGVHGEFVILDGVRLKVSRSRRKGFMEDLSAYFA
jgi:DNA-binding LytR/AlgR family response regulator